MTAQKIRRDGLGPWGVRAMEAKALDAMLSHDDAAAAVALGVSPVVIRRYTVSVRERMRIAEGFHSSELTRSVILRIWAAWRAGNWAGPSSVG